MISQVLVMKECPCRTDSNGTNFVQTLAATRHLLAIQQAHASKSHHGCPRRHCICSTPFHWVAQSYISWAKASLAQRLANASLARVHSSVVVGCRASQFRFRGFSICWQAIASDSVSCPDWCSTKRSLTNKGNVNGPRPNGNDRRNL